MKDCAYCGRENADTATQCRECGTDEFKQPKPPPIQDEEERFTVASFSCATCGGELRLRLPDQVALFRCPKCKTEYRTQRTKDSAPVFLVVPQIKPHGKPETDSPRQTRREISPRVRVALAALGLNDSAELEEIRRAYRELVKSYHPDKVAGLGSELRQVAEKKTKELNGAYQILQEFYAA